MQSFLVCHLCTFDVAAIFPPGHLYTTVPYDFVSIYTKLISQAGPFHFSGVDRVPDTENDVHCRMERVWLVRLRQVCKQKQMQPSLIKN